MPQRQLLGLGREQRQGVGVAGDQRLEQRAGRSGDQPGQREHRRRGEEQRPRPVDELGRCGVGQPGLAGEGAPQEAGAVRGGQRGADHEPGQDDGRGGAVGQPAVPAAR